MAPKRKHPRRDDPLASPASYPAAVSSDIPSATVGEFPAIPPPREDEPVSSYSSNASSSSLTKSQPQHHVNPYVRLNVGGVRYVTTRETLLQCDSLLADWVKNDFKGLPRLADGSIFINRDGTSFKHILNYLRGYDIHVPQEDVMLLSEDTQYFRLTRMMQDLGFASPPQWLFKQGPGVSKSGTQFATTTLLGWVGDTYFDSGVITATFKVDKCDIVAIGAATPAIDTEQGSHVKNLNGATCYLSTGETYFNWELLEELQPHRGPAEIRYKEGDVVTIRLDYTNTGSGVSSLGSALEAESGFSFVPIFSHSPANAPTTATTTTTQINSAGVNPPPVAAAQPPAPAPPQRERDRGSSRASTSNNAPAAKSASTSPPWDRNGKRLVITYFKNEIPVAVAKLYAEKDGRLPLLRPLCFIEGASVVFLQDFQFTEDSPVDLPRASESHPGPSPSPVPGLAIGLNFAPVALGGGVVGGLQQVLQPQVFPPMPAPPAQAHSQAPPQPSSNPSMGSLSVGPPT